MPTSSSPTEPRTVVLLRVAESALAELVGRRIELGPEPLTLGRNEEANVALGDKSMSRKHVRVAWTARGIEVADLGSANGLFVEGRRVGEAILGVGESFRIGQTILEVVVETVAPAPAVAPEPAGPVAPVQPAVAPPVVSVPPAAAVPPATAPAAPPPAAAAAPPPAIAEAPRAAPAPAVAPAAPPASSAAPAPSRGQTPRAEALAAAMAASISAPAAGAQGEQSPEPSPPRARAYEPSPLFERTASIQDIQKILAEMQRPKSLAEEGEQVVTSANKPMVLADPEAIWMLESGKIEIFTVQLQDGAPVGPRAHFVSVDPGQAFFGMDTDRYGMGSGFLAVGKAGSELRKYDTARMLRLAALPEHQEKLAAMVAIWVEALSRRLVKDLASIPAIEVPLAAGQAVEIPAGKRFGSEKGIVWVELPAAQILFDGMASLAWEAEGVLFPLAPGSWLELLGDAAPLAAQPRSTAQAIGDPRLWAGLETFHRLLCECEFLNKKLAVADEFLRLEDKAVQVEAAKEAAYNAIGSVLGGTGVWERPVLGADAEPIFQACQLLGRTQNIVFRQHPDARDIKSFEENVLAIALASRVRTRRVALVDDWWNHDQGPMLGQVDESKAPVAFLPTSATSYDAVDTATGERVRVDVAYSKKLAPFAYTFYRTFGDKAVTAKEVVRFALQGLSGDFRSVAMMGVGLGMLGTLAPMITGKVFDTAIPQAERAMLFQFSIGLFMVAATQAAFKVTQSIAMLRVQGRMDYSAQAAVWDRLMDLPLTFFKNYSAGDLADRAAGVDQIRAIVAGAGVSALLGSFSSVFNVFQMIGYSLELAAVAIGLSAVYVGATLLANYVNLRFQRDEQTRRGKITGLVLQLIGGVAKLRVCGAENHALRVWATAFSEQRKVSFKVGRVRNFMAVWNAAFPTVSSMVIFVTLVKLKEKAAESGTAFEMTTGDFLAFTAAYGVFLSAMQSLGDASLSMLKVVPVWERLRPILETPPEVDGTKAFPSKLTGAIDISHVSFRYSADGPWILKDVSLKIKAGEFVALVGGSGSGKSTLMRLMLGFEMPEMGSIYYDGQDLGTLDLRLVRAQLGVVLQESRLLPADIYRNIVGSSSRTVQEAWDAAEKAGLADDVRGMPMGMHTVISEGGGSFSGGQKQRLMIARAIVHRPKILYLDEATSALDNKTQKIVTESMDKLSATRVVIAHRLSTIINADRICYLEQGQLVEQGTFQELMALGGKFAALAQRQMA